MIEADGEISIDFYWKKRLNQNGLTLPDTLSLCSIIYSYSNVGTSQNKTVWVEINLSPINNLYFSFFFFFFFFFFFWKWGYLTIKYRSGDEIQLLLCNYSTSIT